MQFFKDLEGWDENFDVFQFFQNETEIFKIWGTQKKKKKEREIPPNCDSFIFKFNLILNLYSEIKVKANKKLGHESFALQAPPTLKCRQGVKLGMRQAAKFT